MKKVIEFSYYGIKTKDTFCKSDSWFAYRENKIYDVWKSENIRTSFLSPILVVLEKETDDVAISAFLVNYNGFEYFTKEKIMKMAEILEAYNKFKAI